MARKPLRKECAVGEPYEEERSRACHPIGHQPVEECLHEAEIVSGPMPTALASVVPHLIAGIREDGGELGRRASVG
jgi:hypothetical protein